MNSSKTPIDPITIPSVDDIHYAAERIAGHAVRTPLLESAYLNDVVGGRLLIKACLLYTSPSPRDRG